MARFPTKKSLIIGLVLYRETQWLRCTEALASEAYNTLASLPEIENVKWILVSNDGPSSVINQVEKWFVGKGFDYIVEYGASNNIASARNRVLNHSQNGFVYFTDPDCEIHPGSLKSLIQALWGDGDSKLLAVGGANSPPLSHWLSNTWGLLSTGGISRVYPGQLQTNGSRISVDHLPTCHILIDMERVGLASDGHVERIQFNEKLDFVGEDLEWGIRWTSRGYRLEKIPESRVWHHHSVDFSRWIAKMWRYGRAQVKVFLHHPCRATLLRIMPLYFGVGMALLLFYSFRILLVCGSTLAILSLFYIWVRLPKGSGWPVVKSVFGVLLCTGLAYAAGQFFEIFLALFYFLPINIKRLKHMFG